MYVLISGAIVMADPDFITIAVMVNDGDAAFAWARNHGLVTNANGNICTLTAGCTGTLYNAVVRGRPNIRCGTCKKYRSAYNAPTVFGGANAAASWLVETDGRGRPQTKLQIGLRIAIIWLWAYNVIRTRICNILGNRVSEETVTLWLDGIRRSIRTWYNRAPMIGGPGEVVQIDESYMRGRRKNNVGRVMAGNRVPTAHQNYGNSVVGPWVVGLIWKPRNGGPHRFRFSIVLRRNAAAMQAIITRYVAPGTEIWSDEWRAYRNIPQWGNYTHRTVNHRHHFVDPVTRVNTQRIESNWNAIKSAVLTHTGGVTTALEMRLAEYAWRVEHQKHNPFNSLMHEMQQQYPQN